MLALWKRNAQANGGERSSEVEKWGWRLSGLWAEIGQEEMKTEMNREQSRRSQGVLDAVQSGSWEKHESELGFAIEKPVSWSVETETDGRYRRTYFRPDSPHLSLLVEKGERSTAGPEAGIQWDGMEREFRKQWGKHYKRIRMGEATLGGEVASLWEFEIERKGEPRLRKLYLGRSHTWDSFVLVGTASAADFKQWQPIFDRVTREFRFG